MTDVMTSEDPLNETVEDEINPLPLIVNVKSGLPALTVEGDKNVTDAPVLF